MKKAEQIAQQTNRNSFFARQRSVTSAIKSGAERRGGNGGDSGGWEKERDKANMMKTR